jgi:DNA-binding CsgD family transcriptional regulator
VIHGRQSECATIDGLLEGLRESRSSALVLRGEPGVGKSTLLDYALRQAAPALVLRAHGVETEVQLPFAGLHQLIYPVLDRADALPGPQSSALRAALGLSSGGGGGGERFLVAVATLTLLAEVAAESGLLCVIDDAQWLDPASAEALTFAARRIQAEGVAMLFAARDGERQVFDAAGLPQLPLGGLDRDAAVALLDDLLPEINPQVRDRLLAQTSGNPLALGELATALTADALLGREPLPDPLPVGRRIERVFVQRAHALSDAARRLLIVAAADETGDLATVLRAADAADATDDAIREIEESGLVSLVGASVGFRHPLVRAAIYHGGTFAERQAAHLSIAAVLDADDPDQADRRAWHRAAATVAPDEAVAADLEGSATRALRRGGSASAAAALERAATLSASHTGRGRRLLAAAEAAWTSGQADWSRRLLERAEPLVAQSQLRARLLHQRGRFELRCGSTDRAYALLMDSANGTEPTVASLDTLILAGEAAAAAGNPDWTSAVGALAGGIRTTTDTERMMVALLTGAAAQLRGDLTGGARLLGDVLARAQSLTDPLHLLWAGRAALYLGDEDTARRLYSGAIERARAGAAVGLLISLLNRVAMSDAIAGRSTEAIANATEGLRLARETSLEADTGIALFALALAHADRGDETECRDHVARAHELAATRRLPMIADGARWSRGRLELALGRPAEALACFQTPLDVDNDRYPMRFLDTADLVESAVRAGQPDACRTQFDAYAAWSERAARPSQMALVSRCRALLSDGEEALAHYETALKEHAASEGTYQRARTQLDYGEALRRARQRGAARPQLRAALETFERLSATPWAERARHELRATGETARKRDPSTLDQLTPQELQIARLAQEGGSNREIAAQLFLSPRTVEYHLHKVFTKLRITARGQLVRLDLSDA